MKFRRRNELATPVRGSRQWTTALAPRDGGWDFICQSYVYQSNNPTEWVVVNLEEGTATVSESAAQVYSNSNFQIPSPNTAVVGNNQLRASNGRIFFGQRYGHIGTDLTSERYLNVAYFDPTDRTVHQLPSIQSPASAVRQSAVFSATFDRTGSALYMGSQAVIGYKPFVFSIDPSTLAVTVIGIVGSAASSNPKYAYYLARDVGNNWLYVAVGQDPWELVKIDVTTGEQTVLATTTTGSQFMQFDALTNGWRVTIRDNGVSSRYWVADGTLSAWPGSGAPPSGARTVTPYTNALSSPPQVDWSRGIGQVLWRAAGSTGAWTRIEYEVNHTSAFSIESLLALSNGTVLGNAEQYQGFFRYQPSTNSIDWYGNWSAGLSQPVMTEVDGIVYMCGYPNSALYAYDPEQTWNTGTNPASLGSFFAACGTKYAYHLAHASGHLFMLGRKERDSLGSGLGRYTIATGAYIGTNDNLDNYNPTGFVVLPDIARVAVAGKALDGSAGVIVLYDYALNEVSRWSLPFTDAGKLFAASSDTVVGLSATERVAYRFSVSSGAVQKQATLDAAIGKSAQSGSEILADIGGTLRAIDMASLSVSDVRSDAVSIGAMSSGPMLYTADGAVLYQQSKVSASGSGASRSRRRRDRDWPNPRWG